MTGSTELQRDGRPLAEAAEHIGPTAGFAADACPGNGTGQAPPVRI